MAHDPDYPPSETHTIILYQKLHARVSRILLHDFSDAENLDRLPWDLQK